MKKWTLCMSIAMLSGFIAVGTGCDGGGGSGGVQIQTTQDGAEGFLWKPRSESNGRLVVLLPNSLRGEVTSASIHTTDSFSESTKIEEGRFAGDDHNGERPHYRFNQSGPGYGNDIWVIARTSSGVQGWNIPAGSQRWD